LATDRSVSREAATVPDLLMGRNSEPDTIPAAFSHSMRALTGQATSPHAIDRDRQSGLCFLDVAHIQCNQRSERRASKAKEKARVSSRACHLLLATIEIQVTPAAQEFLSTNG
jgi:hypothetical protein